MTHVLVLGGGPDAEREVSLTSARAVAEALRERFDVTLREVDRLTEEELASLAGDVVFAALHGPWGEGGPMQDMLERLGRAYVGAGPTAARACMDKVGTKLAAAGMGIATPACFLFDPRDERSALDLPFVMKPTHDGSSVGLHVCRTPEDWARAREAVREDVQANPFRSYMIERYTKGRELTVGLLGGVAGLEAIGIVEIGPASGVYDYQAKYGRSDTRYTVDPELPAGVAEAVKSRALKLAEGLGVRDLARVDFMLDEAGEAWLLEVNTMPGFTPTSLLPKAAAARGLSFADLCERLVGLALARG